MEPAPSPGPVRPQEYQSLHGHAAPDIIRTEIAGRGRPAVSSVQQARGNLDTALAHAARLLESRPALAREQALEIIRSVGRHPEALRILASAHAAQGEATQALDILLPLAASAPEWPQLQLDLGLALAQAGSEDQALAALRKAVALKPELPHAWRQLAGLLARRGDHDGAGTAYLQHVRHAVRDPQLMAAAAALHANSIPQAQALLDSRLATAPDDVVALRMLAEVNARLGRYEDSESLLLRCLSLAPGFREARQNLAMVLHRGNKPQEALVEIERLLALDPRNPGYRNLKAVVLCRIGDYVPAIALYAALLAEHPKQAKVWLSYGHALKTAGQGEDAIEAYRRSIVLDPGHGEAWWSLANLKTFRFEAADIAAMRAQLPRTDLDDEQRAQFDFALGKALEDAGEFETAFRHYEAGNQRRRAMVGYSSEDTEKRIALCRRLYTREFFREREGRGCEAPDPIFIVGLPRAGSTLVEQILSSHSQVEGTMELPELISITRDLRQAAEGGTYHEALAALDPGLLRGLGEQYLERTRIHRKSGAPLFIDKMPNNFLHVGLIQLALPQARIIDARRHPLACCLSGYKQYFARGQHFSYSLDDLGRYYRGYVELMAHYDAVLPGRVHRVVYERMVADTEVEVRLLLDYCGLPFEDRCLRFFENDRPVRTASSEQVRRPIYREGVDHWRNFEAWLGPLEAALGPVLEHYPDAPEFSGADRA